MDWKPGWMKIFRALIFINGWPYMPDGATRLTREQYAKLTKMAQHDGYQLPTIPPAMEGETVPSV